MFKNYFKTAFRNLQRNKLYAAINIGGIAVGLAAFWMIALYIGDELSYDRFFMKASRVYRIAQHASWDGGNLNLPLTSAPFSQALKANFPEIEETVRFDPEGGGTITYGEKTLKADDICFTDSTVFKIFDYPFIYGNAATALKSPGTIVITESLAQKIFGNASRALHQTIYFGGSVPNTVTGVISDIPANTHMHFSGFRSFGDALNNDGWQNFYLYTYLLLKPGADYNALDKKLPAFAAKTIQKDMGVKDYRMELQPLTSIHLNSNLNYELSANGSMSRVYMFSVIGILILLIALINYMNLSTSRATLRVKEVGIRKVVGSGRRNLIWLFIAESLLVTMIAAIMAFVIVSIALPYFNYLSGKNLTIWRFGKINTIAALIIFSLFTGILNGSYPAIFLSRFKTIPALKGQLGNMQANLVFRKSLVVFQYAITVCMISGSFIIYSQLQYVLHKDLGFNKEQVLSFHIDDMKVRNQVAALKAQLLQNPLIEGTAVAGNPIGNNDIGGHDFQFEKDGAIDQSAQMAQQLFVDEDFLGTTGIHLLQGRNFSKDMPTDKVGAMLINETLLKQLGWKNAVGKKAAFRVNQFSNLTNSIVIGVVKDFHTYSLQHKIEPLVIMMPPSAEAGDNLYVKISPGKASEALGYIKKVYAQFDKKNAAETHFLDENFAKQYIAEQKQEQLSLMFTILAVVIACLGLFGLATFTASQRIKEIGIRKALGASAASITILLSNDFIKLIAIAIIIAVLPAWVVMNKWLQDFAYRISMPWWVFALAGILTLVIALATISFRAIKAALANPVKSLRTE